MQRYRTESDVNIAHLSEDQQADLARAIKVAESHGRTLRIATGTDKHGPFYKFAIGQGMWTPNNYTDWKD